MIFNSTFRALFVLSAASLFSLVSCREPEVAEAENYQAADSLSIKLNSPELKAVNAELKNDPGNAGLYDKRARVYLSIHELTPALNDAKRAIRLDSSKAEHYLTLIDVYFSQNNTRQAKDLLEITTRKFPSNTEALLKLSELYFLVKQYQKGIDYVNMALKVNEGLARAYYIKGSIYRESGDTTKAISSLETATEQDNRYTDAFYDLGLLFAARKNPLALEYYANALRIDPSRQDVWYARAKLLQDMGRVDEAIAEYRNVIGKFKSCENCYYNLGAIYLEIKNEPKLALENFTKAIELNPGYTEAYFARGYTYSKLKDKENAKADYNMCLRLQPNYEPAIQGLNNL